VGLTAGRVRLAGFSSVVGSLVPRAVATLQQASGLQVSLTDTHPREALELLRAGKIDVAVIFRYDGPSPSRTASACILLDDPLYLLSTPWAHARRAAQRDVDRRLRTVPRSPVIPMRRRRASSRELATPPTTWS
jgi:DNA-binding transcriptional LysR family regulator